MKFLQRLLGRRPEPSSGDVARERLRLVLAHDRASISPGLLDMIKDEIIAVISRHVDIDVDQVQVTFSQETRETRLIADIPLSPGHRRGKR